MKMKARIYLILIFLSGFNGIKAQSEIAGFEQYNTYEQYICIDNLEQRIIPEIFNSTYYSKLKSSDFKIDSQIIDTFRQERYIYVYTKKTKGGYLFVNRKIMDKVKELDCDFDKLKISYVYNDIAVSTKNDVTRILKLRERRIRVSEIVHDEQLGMITVYIVRR